jgi:pyridoxamine 5'-phosphate oxidase family protein
MPLDRAHVRYLTSHAVGRLATVSPGGTPQNKPVGYRYNASLGTIDIAGYDMEDSAKFRNVAVNPEVAFVVDDAVGEGPDGVRFLEIRGVAEQAVDESFRVHGDSSHIIRIHARRVVSWNVDSGNPGAHAENLGDTRP